MPKYSEFIRISTYTQRALTMSKCSTKGNVYFITQSAHNQTQITNSTKHWVSIPPQSDNIHIFRAHFAFFGLFLLIVQFEWKQQLHLMEFNEPMSAYIIWQNSAINNIAWKT